MRSGYVYMDTRSLRRAGENGSYRTSTNSFRSDLASMPYLIFLDTNRFYLDRGTSFDGFLEDTIDENERRE